ncbi:MAG: cytochrome P450 [Calothrix sp. FI2-JRJ7]|jgi:cytochrome P450|nr:cytochrome P450 [Calothrix sp. FI2-JRJ7]
MVTITKPKTQLNLPPGPKGHPVFGVLPDYRDGALEFTTRCAKEYGDIVLWQGPLFRAFQLNHPDYIEEVLVSRSNLFGKHQSLNIFKRLLGNGLVSSDGEFWQRQRRMIQPAFHQERIVGYGKVMVDYAFAMLNSWEDGQERDIHDEMMGLTLEIVAKTLFEADVKQQVEIVGKALETSIEYYEVRNTNLLVYLLPDWFPTRKNLAYIRAMQQMDEMLYSIINQRRVSNQDKGDLLSMLLHIQDEDGARMTDKQLRDEVMTLMFAGHETTALTLSWGLYLLSQHPEVEAKLLEEINAVLGEKAPTFADLPALRYTEQVIMEVMRLYPAAWAIGRQALQDCEIGGYNLRAGDAVIVSQWVMQRDARYFEDPEAFKPERWEGDFAKKLPKFAYFPFGGGSRICIGKSFAMMEAVLLLATITQKYHLELAPGQEITPWPAFTLRPKHGIKMTLCKR